MTKTDHIIQLYHQGKCLGGISFIGILNPKIKAIIETEIKNGNNSENVISRFIDQICGHHLVYLGGGDYQDVFQIRQIDHEYYKLTIIKTPVLVDIDIPTIEKIVEELFRQIDFFFQCDFPTYLVPTIIEPSCIISPSWQHTPKNNYSFAGCYYNIATLINLIITRGGSNQKSIANAIGVSPKTISELVNNRSGKLTAELLFKFQAIYPYMEYSRLMQQDFIWKNFYN